MASDEEEITYCLCRRPYAEDQFMIECDVCKDWFHGSCVGIAENQATEIETYHCPSCQETDGPLILKKRRNSRRRDYSEEHINISKTVQTGSPGFIKELKNRTFASGDEVPVLHMAGWELSLEMIEDNGFTVPILVDCKDGLDLTVPPNNFSIQDVENHVGSMREIDVIDVARQEDCKMLMREWTEYYNSPSRKKIYNVISLEFSNTKLAELVRPPRIVREMSWVSNYWPTDQPPEDQMYQKPEVQRYCLMGIKDSFTDFHIDFGGTSVWYHVLRGEKIFYIIRPTSANLQLYEQWLSSSKQGEMFFGDQVDACYKCVVKTGQTLFIPTGWIHGVLTPIDSLVFGGNFLHMYNIDLQIQIYEIEKRCKTPEKYLFPNYETLHWYAAKNLLDIVKDYTEDKRPPPEYLITGSKSLAQALKSWTHKKDLNNRYIFIKKDSIPETIQYGRLLKELNKEVKSLTPQVLKPKSERRKRSQDSSPSKDPVETKRPRPNENVKKSPTKPRKPKGKKEAEPTSLASKSAAQLSFGTTLSDFRLKEETSPEIKPKLEETVKSPVIKEEILKSPRLLQEMAKPTKSLLPGDKNKSPRLLDEKLLTLLKTPKTEKVTDDKSKSPKSPRSPRSYLALSQSPPSSKLKVRIPKFGAYQDAPEELSSSAEASVSDPSVYDFGDDPEEPIPPSLEHKLAKTKAALQSPPSSSKPMKEQKVSPLSPKVLGPMLSPKSTHVLTSPVAKLTPAQLLRLAAQSPKTVAAPSSALRLKVSGGRVISRGAVEQAAAGKFQLLSPTSSHSSTGDTGVESDNTAEEDNQLVVDESPQRRRGKPPQQPHHSPGNTGPTTIKPGSLKMKLSVAKTESPKPDTLASDTSVTQSSELDTSYAQSSQSESEDADGESNQDVVDRLNMPTIRGGLNGSISDILEASGYGTETDFKIDDEIGRASPSMRDAIQGMLSISQMGQAPAGLQLSSLLAAGKILPPQVPRHRIIPRPRGEEEGGEKMPTCFKDEEFVYPTLDVSDNEDSHVFKPRGRPKKDETWNPKAKLAPNCPKPERPPREGARRESVESGLAAAKAKLADRPAPKRQYIRKKPPKPEKKPPGSLLSSDPLLGSSLTMVTSPAMSSSFRPGSSPPSPTKAGSAACLKKPKKGMATAKQRLSKILKMNKMMM